MLIIDFLVVVLKLLQHYYYIVKILLCILLTRNLKWDPPLITLKPISTHLRRQRILNYLVLYFLSHKWDHFRGVLDANIHTEQRYCLYCIFAQIRVLGDNSTKTAALLSRVTRSIYSYKNKEITHCILIGSSCYTLMLKIYFLYLTTHACKLGRCSLSVSELSPWS